MRILARLGAAAQRSDDGALRMTAPSGRSTSVRLHGWSGEEALRTACWPLGDPARVAPHGDVLTAYAALRLAGAATTSGDLHTGALVRELLASSDAGGPSRPELVRCRDGWVVARWRDEGERRLFHALTGPEPTRANAVAQGRLARLLVAAVERPHRVSDAGLGACALTGPSRASASRPRVVDWTVLWAGPWAAQQLRRTGAVVDRVEHPRRRDGLLVWPAGRRWWRRLNQGKRIALLDAHERSGRRRLDALLGEADILLTSMTPRAVRSLGIDEDWRREHAPGLLHVELVAFEEPWADAPGLGEQAAAQAGLLWRPDGTPGLPYPWADPLLGAATVAICRAWLASARRGGRIRLSLERAAALAFDYPAGAEAHWYSRAS